MIKRMHQNSLLVVFLPLRIKIESLRSTDWAYSLNYVGLYLYKGFPGGSVVMQEMQVQSLGWEDTLEEELATHSSIFAWKIPW